MQGRAFILTAIEFEARQIARKLGLKRKARHEWIGGPFENPDVYLFVVGIRAVYLPKIEVRTGDRLLMAGLAGALDPTLKIGEVLVEPESTMRPVFHTAPSIICTAEQKAALFQQTRARAVEMENQVVRKWAEALSIPVIFLRTISDTAHDSLDPEILRCIDEFGRPNIWRLTSLALRHPQVILKLNILRCNSLLAAQRLADATARWLHDEPLRNLGRVH